jgi:hypothetical protein
MVLPVNAANGGLPEPPAGEPIRVIAALHDACGAATRVRLPRALSPRAVRRFHCASCAAPFETERVRELRLAPYGSRAWQLASMLIAAALVITILYALRGDAGAPAPAASPAEASAATEAAAGAAAAGKPDARAADKGAQPEPGKRIAKASKHTEFVSESSFSLALPAGWERVEPPAGATFAAVAADGGADVTLWIKQDPRLDFPAFISESLKQLETLAGSARIVERTPGPTPEATVVRLAANPPAGQPTYDATLRVAGDYRYFLATSTLPGASPKAIDGAELVAGTFTPELEG